MKESFGCFTYYFGYYRRNNFSCVGYITYRNFFYGKLATTIFFLLGPHIFEGQVDRQVDNALHSVTVIPVASAIRFLDSYPPENRDNDLSVG